MNLTILLIFAFVATCYSQNVTNCYYCESREHPNCDDPFEKVTGTSVNCDDFISTSTMPEVPLRARKLSPFTRAFNQEKRVLDEKVQFRCVKTRITHSDASTELMRMCVPITPTIGSACGYLKELAGDDISMKSCHECKTDNCNGSSYIALSFWSIFAFFLVKVL